MKQKYSELTARIILSVFGIILIGIIIFNVKIFFTSTNNTSKHVIDQSEKLANSYADYDIEKYDGENIRGSEVVNFIKENLGDYSSAETAPIYAYVETVVSGTTYKNKYVNISHISDIKNFTKTEFYINPTAYFNCTVVKTTNKAILGVNFIQK